MTELIGGISIEAVDMGLIRAVFGEHGVYLTAAQAAAIIAMLTKALKKNAKSDALVIRPRHVIAARNSVGWQQKELASSAGVARSTVADFERGVRNPTARNLKCITEALEAAGITFLEDGVLWR